MGRTMLLPPFYYHGAKLKLHSWIMEHAPRHATYCEPFLGSGAVMLNKPPASSEVGNDKDGWVIAFFRALRDDTDEVIRKCIATPFHRGECADAAHKIKTTKPTDYEPGEAARIFHTGYLQSFSGVLGGWGCGLRRKYAIQCESLSQRVGLQGDLAKCAARLKFVAFENKDAIDILRAYDEKNTLFYCDPPYVFSKRAGESGGQYACEMTDTDHENFVSSLLALNKASVIVSGYDTPIYKRLEDDGWEVVKREVVVWTARAEVAGNRAKKTECLWIKK